MASKPAARAPIARAATDDEPQLAHVADVDELIPLFVGPDDAARLLGVSKPKIYEGLHSGQLVARRWGRRTLIQVDDLLRFASSLPLAEPSAAAAERAEVRSITDGRRAG